MLGNSALGGQSLSRHISIMITTNSKEGQLLQPFTVDGEPETVAVAGYLMV